MEFKNKRAEGIYKTLETQLKAIRKHNRQGSNKTKERYYEANQRFCKYLAEEYGTQKFANIQGKHLDGYAKHMQEKGLGASTIKTDLAGIRFYHDKCSNTRHHLPQNKDLTTGLEKRVTRGVDRAISNADYKAFQDICDSKGTYSYERTKNCAVIAREMGLRVHETTKLGTYHVEQAKKTGEITIKGKNGKERTVPVTPAAMQVLNKCSSNVSRGDKLFVGAGEKTHLVVKQIQNNINRSRSSWQTTGGANRTYHGFRHAYAREKYDQFTSRGMSDYEAKKCVSELLGHERDEVTNIYLCK